MEDSWNLGEAYELFMGRWSRPAAAEFLRWLERPSGTSWLDVGCGTGALSGLIGQTAAPQHVTGIDFSQGFINHARQRHPEPIYDFRVGSALALPVDDDSVDTVVSGLALNFFPEPETAVKEMRRVVKKDGIIAVYVWDYAAGMEMLRYFWDAAAALDPAATALDEGGRFPICHPEALQAVFGQAGLDEVQVRPLDTAAIFANFDDYWRPFLGRNGPAPSYVARLTPTEQDALIGRLRLLLPIQPDGQIPLNNRAWAIRGIKQ